MIGLFRGNLSVVLSAIYCIFLYVYDKTWRMYIVLFISHIIAKIYFLGFFFFCLSVGCVIRVTVGVVIGVADLILPDKNIGEVGRKFTEIY